MKAIFSAAAIALTFIAFYPYVRSILRGETKPHVFSWIIWGTTTLSVFLVELKSKGGVGAWPIGASGVLTLVIAWLAFIRRGDISITRLDWVFFLAALSAIPVWHITANPLWAAIILTFTDMLGFGPTIRKVIADPQSENPLFYILFFVEYVLVLLALESYTITNVLFPLALITACSFMIGLIYYRRNSIKHMP